MDKIIDSRFERVEKALATLINSISTYNPSTAHANELVTADAELSKGLEALSTHQSNHAKIHSLRATSAALDTQIRDTILLLTSTRSELLATPATTFPTNTNPVSYSELLSYARRISKFTLPATFREAEAAVVPETSEAQGNTPKEAQTNGATTPVTVTNGGIQIGEAQASNTAMDIDRTTPTIAQAQNSQDTSLPPEWQQYLDTSAGLQFVPWPSEETIRRGALASIQILADQGVDLETFDPARSAELEAERQRIEEENERAREEEKARIEEERKREMERRMSISGNANAGRREEEKPKVFQLETFDDDEDD